MSKISRNTLIALVIETPRQFEGDANDNRTGLWLSDIRMERLDQDGNHLEWINNNGSFGSWVGHSGLQPTEKESYYTSLELARAAQRALVLIGLQAFIKPQDSSAWDGSSEFLSYHLRDRQRKIEAQAQAAEMRRQARELVSQARQLAA